jgi:hypothetical protein
MLSISLIAYGIGKFVIGIPLKPQARAYKISTENRIIEINPASLQMQNSGLSGRHSTGFDFTSQH